MNKYNRNQTYTPELETITQYLEACAKTEHTLTYYSDGTSDVQPYKDLLEASRLRAANLRKLGAKAGEVLIILCNNQKQFVENFWAAIVGGFVGVPLSVPTNEEAWERLAFITENDKSIWIVTDSQPCFDTLEKKERNIFSTDLGKKEGKYSTAEMAIHNAKGSDVAYLQYSSGSTSAPKGVMVTHKNLLVNIATTVRRFGVESFERMMSWLPLTHDFGLILFHIAPIVMMKSHILVPAASFIKDPFTLFEGASHFKATFSGITNSGVAQMVETYDYERAKHWDLTSLKHLPNGAEQINPAVTKKFVELMKPHGLSETAMKPGYGLAEATLVVSVTYEDMFFIEADRRSLAWGSRIVLNPADEAEKVDMVSVGPVLDAMPVRIVNEHNEILQDGYVGLIQIKSESNTQGYWNNEELSKTLYTSDGWLNSGDLGFILEDNLFIAGRVKEIIIIGGVNYYPHDIEKNVADIAEIPMERVASTAVEEKNGTEALGVFVEWEEGKDFYEMSEKIATTLFRNVGVLPRIVAPVEKLPRTSSNKVQRLALSESYRLGEFDEFSKNLEAILKTRWSRIKEALMLGNKEKLCTRLTDELSSLVFENASQRLNPQYGFMEQGISSLRIMAMLSRFSQIFEREFENSFLFDYPTLEAVTDELLRRNEAENLSPKEEASTQNNTTITYDSNDVAVVGMACHFPQADSIDEYWSLLTEQKIAFSMCEELHQYGAYISKDCYDLDKESDNGKYNFGMTQIERDNIEAHQKLLLKTTYEAIEHAFGNANALKGTDTSVYVGLSNAESMRPLFEEPESSLNVYSILGSMMSSACGRISHLFDLHGESISLDTACSSSLVTIIQACQSLIDNRCETALAGGVNLIQSSRPGTVLSMMGALSPSGVCRPYCDNADGYIRGEGCGMVVLKRVSDALRDGNTILGVIKASAIGHDGRAGSLSAPNGTAQRRLLRKMLEKSNISPSDICYIEGHGTGTPLGDPIELNSIGDVISKEKFNATGKTLPVGSIKAQIGHLESAAGIASFVKVLLGLQHKSMPAMPMHGNKGKYIDWNALHLDVAQSPIALDENALVCINSFGISGTISSLLVAPYNKNAKGGCTKTCAMQTNVSTQTQNTVAHTIQKPVMQAPIVQAPVVQNTQKIVSTVRKENPKKQELEASVLSLLTQIIGADVQNELQDDSWFKLGLDSLVLVQVTQGLNLEFGFAPEVNDFFQPLDTPRKLATFMAEQSLGDEAYITEEVVTEQVVSAPVESAQTPVYAYETQTQPASQAVASSAVENVLLKQVEAMQNIFAQQLSMLSQNAQPLQEGEVKKKTDSIAIAQKAPIQETKVAKTEVKGLFKDLTSRSNFTQKQFAHIEKLTKEWTALSSNSKKLAIRDRKHLAGPRSMIGFKPEWKNLIYPLVVTKSQGAHVWDIDGREYVDITGSFGAGLFGHAPAFVSDAIKKELNDGFGLGPHHEVNGRVAEMFCSLTKTDRVAFFSSGTEAVMVAVRLARSVLKKQKIVVFANSFHGSFDAVLASGWANADNQGYTTLPITDGTTQGMVEDTIVLRYGDPKALEFIKNNADSLAAVLVEPIQSRNPALQPYEFVKELRDITKSSDIALIFDEMITGLRMSPGGMQELWGIEADIVTYGKVLGACIPVGAVAGKNRFMDAVDGGKWNYDDTSLPTAHTAFVAGTFSQHPLSMIAAEAVLKRIIEDNGALQKELAEKTKKMCQRLDEIFARYKAPIKTEYFSSLFRFDFRENSEILNFHLLKAGIFVWEGRNCFLSTEHTDNDIEKIISAIEKGVKAMADDGWFDKNPTPPMNDANGGSTGKKSYSASQTKASAFAIPLLAEAKNYAASSPQTRLWLHDQIQPGLCVYNIGLAFIAENFDEKKLLYALKVIMQRHDVLRTAFVDEDGQARQYIEENPPLSLERVMSDNPERDAEIFVAQAFDLSKAPLLRAKIFRNNGEENAKDWLIISIHHSVCDVWSFGILIQELIAIYHDKALSPAPRIRFRDYAAWSLENVSNTDHVDWTIQRLKQAQRCTLPLDFERPSQAKFTGKNLHASLSQEGIKKLALIAEKANSTIFAVISTIWAQWLSEKIANKNICFGLAHAGRTHPLTGNLMGFFVEVLPLCLQLTDTALDSESAEAQAIETFIENVRNTQKTILESSQKLVPSHTLMNAIAKENSPLVQRGGLVDVVLVQDSRNDILPPLREVAWDAKEIDTPSAQYDFLLNVSEDGENIALKLAYDDELYMESTVKIWFNELIAAFNQADGSLPRQEEIFVPNFHQERLWFVDRFEKNVLYSHAPTYYTMPIIKELDFAIESNKIHKAIDILAQRHPLFSLSMEASQTDNAMPSMIKGNIPQLPIIMVNSREEIIKKAQAPFDLDKAPLARVILTKDGKNLALSMHHSIADYRTLNILCDELLDLIINSEELIDYETKKSYKLLPYTDFENFATKAEEERKKDWLNTDNAHYWKEKLEGIDKLTLPYDNPRQAVHIYEQGYASFKIAPLSIDKIRTGYAAFLHRLSLQDDIVIGEVIEHKESDSFDCDTAKLPLGPMLQLIPLRSIISQDSSLSELELNLQKQRLEAISHANIPFDQLVIAVKPQNDMSRTALFDVLFVEDTTKSKFDTLNTPLTALGFGKYDLVCMAREDGTIALSWNKTLFDDKTAEEFVQRFEIILNYLASEQEQSTKIFSLDVLLENEKLDISSIMAQSSKHLPLIPMTLDEKFAQIAKKFPKNIAIKDATREITYKELDQESNRIANTIVAKASTLINNDNQWVATFLDRSWHIPASFMGVLKAGKAYIPIDPSYPDDRILYILKNSEAKIIITDEVHSKLLYKILLNADLKREDFCIILMEDLDDNKKALSIKNTAESAAYVIYTSGSTGTPRGVVIEHQNVYNLLFQQNLIFTFDAQDVWTMFHSPCFDFSVWEMYGALLFGGKLLIISKDVAAAPDVFTQMLEEEKVSVLNLTPTAFYELSDYMVNSSLDFNCLRYLVFGGEALRPARLAEWHKSFGHVEIINMYGITETTVHVTWAKIASEEIEKGQSIIGRPLPSWGIIIMDKEGKISPRGEVGEICVYGGGVSRGYLNNALETAKKFVQIEGHKLYKSGDLGKVCQNGMIEYLGRMDDQVKIRGFRIELGEVEHALISHPSIKDAVAMPILGSGEDKHMGELLAAYIVLNEEISAQSLQRYLTQALPDYMIPGKIEIVPAIPLTKNGKADKKKLLSQTWEQLVDDYTPTQEISEEEQDLSDRIIEIWKEVLQIETIEKHDNFFHIGGHSLKANQVVVRIKNKLNYPLSLKDFFAAPSPILLASHLIEMQASSANSKEAISRIENESTQDKLTSIQTYPLSFAQESMWIWQQKNPHSAAYNMVGGFKLIGELDCDSLEKAINLSILKHESLRTSFDMQGGHPVQKVESQKIFTLIKESYINDDFIEKIYEEEMNYIFDLSSQELYHIRLFAHEKTKEYYLIFNLHHILGDGWSAHILMKDIENNYRKIKGFDVDEDEIEIMSYGQYAKWQRDHMHELDASKQYWMNIYEELPKALEYIGIKRPSQRSGKGALISQALGLKLSKDIRSLAKKFSASPFMLFHALASLQMHILTKSKDIVLGSPVAGRDFEEIENTLGFMLNMLPIRTQIASNVSFMNYMAGVKEHILDAFAHQSYPFECIVSDLALAVEKGRQPLFDAILIFQNNEALALDLPDIESQVLSDRSISARYDLKYQFDDEQDILFTMEYDTEIFDEDFISQLMLDFVKLTSKVLENNQVQLSEIIESFKQEEIIINLTREDLLMQSDDDGDGW